MEHRIALLKVLADETRLNIINALMRDDSYVEKLAAELDLTPATICYHLKKMENAGLVHCSRSQFYVIYALNREFFTLTLEQLVTPPAEEAAVRQDSYEASVLSHFFRFGKLTQIPAQRKKREIVLRHMVQAFSADRTYTEAEVSEILSAYHDDYCTLRREMIGMGLMTRENGIYRRTE